MSRAQRVSLQPADQGYRVVPFGGIRTTRDWTACDVFALIRRTLLGAGFWSFDAVMTFSLAALVWNCSRQNLLPQGHASEDRVF
jgi:hypothetical protein